MLKKLFALMGISVIFWFGCSNSNNGTPVTPAQPTITGFTPANVSRGAQNLNGKITGTNLGSVTHVDLGTGVTVQSATAPNANEIDIQFSVALNASAGAHTITVTTTAGSASSSTVFTVINNKVPTAAFTVTPTKGGKNTTYVCDATASKDGDGSISTYHWTFGDGKSGNGRTIAHQYATAGTFTITLTVTDNDKGQSSITHSVEVANGFAPVPHFVVTPESGEVGTVFTFDASDSTDDGVIKSYAWKFGDGASANGAVVKHKYTKSGEMNVVLTVTDDSGLASALDKTLRVENFDVAKNEAEIDALIRRFFRRFAELDHLSPEVIVEGWSLDPMCPGREHEIKIIEKEQATIKSTTAEIEGQIDILIHDDHVNANAVANAKFDFIKKNGDHGSGKATHNFTLVFEGGEWLICNFTLTNVENGAQEMLQP